MITFWSGIHSITGSFNALANASTSCAILDSWLSGTTNGTKSWFWRRSVGVVKRYAYFFLSIKRIEFPSHEVDICWKSSSFWFDVFFRGWILSNLFFWISTRFFKCMSHRIQPRIPFHGNGSFPIILFAAIAHVFPPRRVQLQIFHLSFKFL